MGALFDADTDQVTYGDVTTLDGLTTLTLGVWVKLDSVASASRRWVSKWGAAPATNSLVLAHGAAGTTLVIATSDGSTNATGTETSLLATGSTWVHYLVTWSGGGAFEIYKDGTGQSPSNAGSNATVNNSTSALTLGQDAVGVASLLGALAEVAIWNRVLSIAERAALFARSSPLLIPNGLLWHAPLNGTLVSTIGPQPTGSTGITFTDHPPIIQRTSGAPYVAAVSTAPAGGTAFRRVDTELGTRIGSRQPQEA